MFRKFIIIFLIIMLYPISSFADTQASICDQYVSDMEYAFMTRGTVYNTLNLTDEQIEFREKILSENIDFYSKKFSQLLKKCYEYDALKSANASKFELYKVKKSIWSIRNQIEKKIKQEDKKFNKQLNKKQRKKYKLIMRLENRDMHKKTYDYYKKNPQMQKFY